MLTLHLPFLPPTLNHATKRCGNRYFSTDKYNQFKARVAAELCRQFEAPYTELRQLLNAPHKVTLVITSPAVFTKKGLPSKTFSDIDNKIKPTLDAIYKPLAANDALVFVVTASKQWGKKESTLITWAPLIDDKFM